MSQNSPNSPRSSLAWGIAKVLVGPLLLTAAIVIILDRRSAQPPRQPAPPGWSRVMLAQKDDAFHEIPADRGGASGSVLYRPRGSTLPLQYRAKGLEAGLRYLIELEVDGTVYTVASRAADSTGALALDTTLTRFAEGVCVGTNYDAPRPLAGTHTIKFWLKRDGNAASGTQADVTPGSPEPTLPCRGNGDQKFGYVLLDNDVAHFEGTSPGS